MGDLPEENFAVEVVDDAAHLGEDFTEDFGTKPTFAEAYAQFERCLHLHVRCRRRIEPHGDDFCTVSQRAGRDRDLGLALLRRVDYERRQVGFLDGNERGVHEAVLVRVGKRGEDCEPIEVSTLPSTVGLQPVDERPVLVCDSSEHAVAEAGLPVLRTAPVTVSASGDGELVVSPGLGSVEYDQLPYKVIECGPGVVEEVSKQYPPAEVVRRFVDAEVRAISRAINVDVRDNRVWLSINEGVDLVVERFEVFLGALNLRLGAV